MVDLEGAGRKQSYGGARRLGMQLRSWARRVNMTDFIVVTLNNCGSEECGFEVVVT